mgnify:CR=1 FL=1
MKRIRKYKNIESRENMPKETIIDTDIGKDEVGIPPVIIHETLDHLPLSETYPGFLQHRGDFQKLKTVTNNGKGVKVGVGDTGVDKTHLDGDLAGVVEAKDFTGSRYGYYDRNAHGSHTTGHISGRGNGQGIEGLASDCEVYHAKVLGDSGSGSTRGIANGIRWMVDQGCQIINLSLGGGFSHEIEGACREAAEQGVMVMASMGNSGTRGSGHPGNSRYTFGICAIDYNKRIANFSSRGESAKYSGYGVRVLSCGLNGRYTRMSGTSMAAPDVTGITTLYYSYRIKNNLALPQTMEDLEGLFRPAVEDLGSPGHDIEYGLGFVDIWELLNKTNPEQLLFSLITTEEQLFIQSNDSDAVPATLTVGDKTFETKMKPLIPKS